MNTTFLTGLHFTDSNTVLVDFKRGTYELDGQVFVIDATPEKREIEFEKLTTLFQLQQTVQVVEYRRAGEVVTLKEYQIQLDKLLENATFDDDEPEFRDLEDEYAHKRFRRDHIPQNASVFRKIPVLVNLQTSVADAKDKFIKPLFTTNTNGVLFEWQREADLADTLKTLCDLMGAKLEIAAEIRFAKVEGKYVFGNDMNNRKVSVIGTLDNIKQMQKEEKELLTHHVKAKFYESTNQFNVNFLPKILLQQINSLVFELGKLEVKQKSSNDYRRTQFLSLEIKRELENFFIKCNE